MCKNMNQGGGAASSSPQSKLREQQNSRATRGRRSQICGPSMAEDYRRLATQAWERGKGARTHFAEDGEEYVRENPMRAVSRRSDRVVLVCLPALSRHGLRNPRGREIPPGWRVDRQRGRIIAQSSPTSRRARLLRSRVERRCCLQLWRYSPSVWGALVWILLGYIFRAASLIVVVAHGTGVSWTWWRFVPDAPHHAGEVCHSPGQIEIARRLYPRRGLNEARSQMAEIPKQDRAAIKSDIALSRERVAAGAKRAALRGRFSGQIEKVIRHHPRFG